MGTTANTDYQVVQKWLSQCRHILELTRRQGHCIAAGDFIGLEALLAERGQIMEQLGNTEGHWAVFHSPVVAAHREEIVSLLKEINRLEQANRQAVADATQWVRSELAKLEGWRRVVRAYGGGNWFVDMGIPG
ncbi:MAG: hypothetical protein ACOX3A_02305 [bacterium]|jgi:hypothetical protein